MLYPKENECRMVQNLDGFWNFKIEGQNEQVDVNKSLTSSMTMAVPASFNDQVIDEKIRNHDGYFWYETSFEISKLQMMQRNILRFGSVTHGATVYINGQEAGHHVGGFTPFEIELNGLIHAGKNDLKVRVSNLLSHKTIPVGELREKDGQYHTEPNFDFFNYAGIHRPVKIYTTSPDMHIDEIVVKYDTDLKKTTVKPELKITGDYQKSILTIIDEDDQKVATTTVKMGEDPELKISDTHLWQPMNAYLYQLRIELWNNDELADTYTQSFGVRKVEVKDCKIYVNDHPIYLKGFGRHEDFPIIGKGMNRAVINHDHQTMKWMHANAFRTSHYPYSEEEMQLADRDGFLIIDEVPAVGLFANFTVAAMSNTETVNTWQTLDTMAAHKQVLRETITRDQNHPAVIMWSVANEPASQQKGAHEYFKEIVDYTHSIDWQHLPLLATKILSSTVNVDLTGDLFDVIALNRYYGWYVDFNELAKAKADFEKEIKGWHAKFPDKPIIFTEFGADTLSGMHSIHREPYSEEYQHDYYQMNFDVFDEFDYVCGELLWNFADFETPTGMIRIGGNKKGIFTRDREPKQIVYDLRKRWEKK